MRACYQSAVWSVCLCLSVYASACVCVCVCWCVCVCVCGREGRRRRRELMQGKTVRRKKLHSALFPLSPLSSLSLVPPRSVFLSLSLSLALFALARQTLWEPR